MTQPHRTILFDSSGSLHACFHGYPPRSANLGGEEVEVAALYGYMAYTCRLIEEFQCDRLIHVLDPEGGSKYRFDLYPEYKANRSPTDPKLTRQKQLLPQLLEAVGQSYLMIPGVESDDVIATLTKRAREEGSEVLIISQDKDLLQLVDDNGVCMARYVPGSDGKGKLHKFYQEADVLREFGVRPNQMADYLAIVGDSTDNIPGVTDAGPKTAVQWLQQYGNLATLKTNIDEVKGRGSKGLRADIDKLDLFQKLTTALYDVEEAIWPQLPVRDAELCRSAIEILGGPAIWLEHFGYSNEAGYTTRSPRP